MSKTLSTKILLRNDTAARWESNNPVLAKGEVGITLDSLNGSTISFFKVGDGVTHWNDLPFANEFIPDYAGDSTDGIISSTDYVKLQGIEAGADVSPSIQVNGAEVTPVNGVVSITVPTSVTDLSDGNSYATLSDIPTAVSDLTNDSGFITTSDIPQGAAATTTTPLMDGTAAVGTELAFARGDHRHPSDTNKVNTSAIQTSLNLSSTSDTNIYSQKVINNALNGKVDNSTLNDYYTKTQIDNKISSVFNYKGTKAAVANLPSSGNTTGDVWHVTATDSEYVWDGSQWQELGGVVDLSGYLQSVSIAGTTLTPSSNSITAASLKTALSMGAAAEKAVDSSISSTSSTNLPTSAAVASYVSSHATQVAASATNGHITVDNTDVTVYTLPSTVVQSSDVLILDCGNSTNNYS